MIDQLEKFERIHCERSRPKRAPLGLERSGFVIMKRPPEIGGARAAPTYFP
jgi:hypothetical protein